MHSPWYYSVSDRSRGPFTKEQLFEIFRKPGGPGREAVVFNREETRNAWILAEDVPGLLPQIPLGTPPSSPKPDLPPPEPLEEIPEPAELPEIPVVATPPTRQHPMLAWALGVLVFLGGAGIWYWQHTVAQHQAEIAEAQAKQAEAERRAQDAEEQRLAALAAAQAKQAETERFAQASEERRLAEIAEAQAKRAEAERLAKEAEKKRLAEVAEAQAKQAEAERLVKQAELAAKQAEEKRQAELAAAQAKLAEAEQLAKETEEKRVAEAAAAQARQAEEARLAKQAAEAKRLAEAEAEKNRLKKEDLRRTVELGGKVSLELLGCDIGPEAVPFGIGKTEVTQEQWTQLMKENPSSLAGASLPVENISWNEAVAFCRELNKREKPSLPDGYEFRLLTETEWVYACQAGKIGRPYGGTGNLDEMGWYKENSGYKLHPVAQKQPNAWGLYDMHGNVSEWCQDNFDAKVADGKGVLRGGNWYASAGDCSSYNRQPGVKSQRLTGSGFRVALAPEKTPFAKNAPAHAKKK